MAWPRKRKIKRFTGKRVMLLGRGCRRPKHRYASGDDGYGGQSASRLNCSRQICQPISGNRLVRASSAAFLSSSDAAVCGIHERKIENRLLSGLFTQLSSIFRSASFANTKLTRRSCWVSRQDFRVPRAGPFGDSRQKSRCLPVS